MNCRNLHILLLLMLTQGAEEFKSVKDVPPANFLEQFSKDLKNSEVSDLSQIKWIFDGKKAPADFKEKMLEEIKKLNIPVPSLFKVTVISYVIPFNNLLTYIFTLL